MLKWGWIILLFIVLFIVIYGFFIGNREIIFYMFIFLGGMVFIISLEEILK